MHTSFDHRALARQALRGNWGKAILVSILAGLLGASGSWNTGYTVSQNVSDHWEDLYPAQFSLPPGVLTLLLIIAILGFLIGPAIRLGYCRYNVALIRDEQPDVGTLFSQFNNWLKAIGLTLLESLVISALTLLLIIPGIIAAYSYSMTFYVLMERPELGILEAMRESRRIMRGNRMQLFCLQLSFIGWALLSVLTLGIGFIWLEPYMQASTAAFYLDASKPEALIDSIHRS